jgi:hypothetical protein
MEGTWDDSQYESQFPVDSESYLLPRRELVSSAQYDDDDAGFVVPVPPARAPSLTAAA